MSAQVFPEGSAGAVAAARLIGRESLPLAQEGVQASTPALERDSKQSQHSAAATSNGTANGAFPSTTPASGQPHGSGCGCSDGETSAERAFAITTADADWGVSIARWQADGAVSVSFDQLPSSRPDGNGAADAATTAERRCVNLAETIEHSCGSAAVTGPAVRTVSGKVCFHTFFSVSELCKQRFSEAPHVAQHDSISECVQRHGSGSAAGQAAQDAALRRRVHQRLAAVADRRRGGLPCMLRSCSVSALQLITEKELQRALATCCWGAQFCRT